jgi:hypothetical protein
MPWPEICEAQGCGQPATRDLDAVGVPGGDGSLEFATQHLCEMHAASFRQTYHMLTDEPLQPMNHKHLLSIVPRLPQDYPPFGLSESDGAGDCSRGCRWYARLAGAPSDDWGVCTNAESHRCGLLTFEHQGCARFEYDETLTDTAAAAEFERFLAQTGFTDGET